MGGFGGRLADAVSRRGPLCPGIDPHPELIRAWGLTVDADGLAKFCDVCVAAFADFAVVKPQVAFFEAFGAQGFAVLERTIGALQAAGVLVLADAKRGDIGSTMAAYADAWAGDSPLAADAVTASPYLGFGSLQPLLDTAAAHDRGVFVLAATSNPEAESIQKAVVATGSRAGATVARAIIDDVTSFNQAQPAHAFGTVGLVLGATVDLGSYGIDTATASAVATPVLAPGFGHQGAQVRDVARLFGSLAGGVIVSESRGLLSAGPSGLADAIRSRATEVRSIDV